MNLTIFFDHRYRLAADGKLQSPTHYNYELFKSRYLQIFGHVDIITRTPHQIGQRSSLGPGVDVISVGTWNGVFDFLRKKPAIQRLARTRIDLPGAVLMIIPGKLGEIASRELIKKGRPFAVEVVGDPNTSLAAGTLKHPLRPLIRRHYAYQQKIICSHASTISYVSERALQKEYPAQANAFSTNYSSIELEESHFAESPKTFQNHGSRWNLINVGMMNVFYKGQLDLIDAIAHCRADGLDVELTLLGDGTIRPELEKHAAEKGVANAVHFRGLLEPGDPVRAELDLSDLFVLPSLTEGLPRALLEAMARGLPCVGTNIPGIAELLEEQCLTPIRNGKALAGKISSFLGQHDLLESQAKRNHAKAQQYLSSILKQRRLDHYSHLREVTEAHFGQYYVTRKAA